MEEKNPFIRFRNSSVHLLICLMVIACGKKENKERKLVAADIVFDNRNKPVREIERFSDSNFKVRYFGLEGKLLIIENRIKDSVWIICPGSNASDTNENFDAGKEIYNYYFKNLGPSNTENIRNFLLTNSFQNDTIFYNKADSICKVNGFKLTRAEVHNLKTFLYHSR